VVRVLIDPSPFTYVKIFIDAAFSAHTDGRGQTGAVATEIITRKQRCATRDSTESELVGLADMLLEVEYHHQWYLDQGVKLDPPMVFQDNKSTIILSEQGGGKFRNKHLRATQAVVKQAVDQQDVIISYIHTDNMIADLLTKPLEGWKFHRFVKLVLKGLCVCKIMERVLTEIENAIRRHDTTGVRCEAPATYGTRM